MSILKTHTKQPGERLDYDFDYSQWLAADDEVISATFDLVTLDGSVPSSPMTMEGEVVRPTYTKVWLVGGSAGEIYKVTCTVTTARGRVKQDEIKIRLKEY